jgi:hypothetical protein
MIWMAVGQQNGSCTHGEETLGCLSHGPSTLAHAVSISTHDDLVPTK